jgi:hypothetical protein
MEVNDHYRGQSTAICSLPQLIVGWRVPGSKVCPWITAIEKDSGGPGRNVR